MTKVCVRCGAEKLITEFSADPQRSGGRHPYCKPCKAQFMRAANKRWREGNPDSYRRHNKTESLRRFGRKHGVEMNLALYEVMLSAQDGRCLICGDEPDALALAVDHNHETGKVRGLLCRPCNLGLGAFRDRQEVLRAAANYLDTYDQPQPQNTNQED